MEARIGMQQVQQHHTSKTIRHQLGNWAAYVDSGAPEQPCARPDVFGVA